MRSYASTKNYGSRIEDEEKQRLGCDSEQGAQKRDGVGSLLKRVVGAGAVCLGFYAAAVSGSSLYTSRRTAGGSSSAAADHRPPVKGGAAGTPGHGKLESWDERFSTTWQAGEDKGEDNRGGGLTLVATNEYGEYDRKALALYGLEMVVEPFRETRITVSNLPGASSMRFRWLLILADDAGAPLDSAEPLVDSSGGSFATVTLTEPGTKYALLVQHVTSDGSAGAVESRTTITCKRVRRELRDLTEADRTGFFSAMREFYTVTREEGREKYGDGFAGAKYVAAYHNSREYCYHNGMHFLNAHAAFGLWMEQNLQMIDPKVSLPQWDYMLDSDRFGTSWGSSEVFGSDMFGSASGSPENQFQISDGWFAGITSVYDPQKVVLASAVNGTSVTTNYNPYGFVDGSFNFQALPGVIRTNSYCGLESASSLPRCDAFVTCFESCSSLYDWATCMEQSVHASIHGMIGGGFDCNVDMFEFRQNSPQFSPGLLSFVLEYIVANRWPTNGLMGDYNACNTECDVDQTQPCGCTCTTDPFEWTDEEVYQHMKPVLQTLQGRAHGDNFIDEDTNAEFPIGFMQDGTRLDEDSTMLLLRQLMVIGCEPGKMGAMSTGASPLDPIFWVLHTGFEKASHIVQLSPGYRDAYDFAWVDSDRCSEGSSGSKLTDLYPFTERMLGFGDGSEFLTNERLLELLHPLNPKVPYLYEGFEKWGTCTDWDPCPECSAAVSSRP
ncbi:unnamed protein product [Pylaiella littoralis]